MSKVQLISQLRKQLHVPLSRARVALEKNGNDYEAALAWLRAQDETHKVADRVISAGLISYCIRPHGACLVDMGCETDFVAKTDVFCGLSRDVSGAMMHVEEGTRMDDIPLSPTTSISDAIRESISQVRENVKLRRIYRMMRVSDHASLHVVFDGYAHNHPLAGFKTMGTSAAIVALLSTKRQDGKEVQRLARGLAQHIVGMQPTSTQELLQQEYLLGGGSVAENLENTCKEFNLGHVRIAGWKRMAVGDTLESDTVEWTTHRIE